MGLQLPELPLEIPSRNILGCLGGVTQQAIYSLCQNYGPPPFFQYLTCVTYLRECKHYHWFPYDVYIPHWSLFLIHSLGYPTS